jgi:PKD repeat protein
MRICVLGIFLLGLLPVGCGGSSIDGRPPDLSLRASVREGRVPLQVTLSIDCSETSPYTIDRFEWDFDGDGVVDLTTRPLGSGAVTADTLAGESHAYTAAWKYSPKAHVLFKQNDAGSWAYLGSEKLSSGDYSHDLVVAP